MDRVLQKLLNSTYEYEKRLEAFDLCFSDPDRNRLIYGSSSSWSRPFAKGGRLVLWQTDGKEKTVPVACYCFEKSGWMNRQESAVLVFKSDTITFTRKKNSGRWKYENRELGTIELSTKMRMLRLGTAQLFHKEATFGIVSLPLAGPGNTGKNDCVADLSLGDSMKIPLVLESRFIQTSLKDKIGDVGDSLKGGLFATAPHARQSPILSTESIESILKRTGDAKTVLFCMALTLWLRSLYL